MTPVQFYAIFIPSVVVFALVIWVVGKNLYEKVPPRPFLVGVLILIGGIIAGVVMMFQPFVLNGFAIGFGFVGISLILFMIWSHVQPRTRLPGPPSTGREPTAGGKSAKEV